MTPRKREFTAPNGMKATFWFRDGTNDESTIIALFEEDYYGLLGETFAPKDVVIDLGAHIGGLTVLANLMGLWVVSMEPFPENCQLLRTNMTKNELKPKLHQKLAWSKSGEYKEVFYGDGSETGKVHNFVGTMNLSKSRSFSRIRKRIKIETLSLDELFETEGIEECAFLKMDIEGAEWDVITGASQKTLDKIKTIRGEYHLGDYHDLFKKIKGFKDVTPPEMNPAKESQTEFLWRRG